MEFGQTYNIFGRLGRHTPAGVAILLAAVSCAPSYVAPPVGAPFHAVSNAPQSRLQRGYEIHQTKCAKCHSFEDPADYSEIELTQSIMPSMAKKAKINQADEEAVLAYLLAARNIKASR